MPTYSPAVASARASYGIHRRWHPDDVEGLAERRREFITEKLAALLERNLDDEVILTDGQIDRLVTILRTAGRGHAR